MSFWPRVLETRITNQFLSGYDVEFVNAVDEDLFCSICKLPLRKPVQTKCGHRFCKGCIDKVCERLAFALFYENTLRGVAGILYFA